MWKFKDLIITGFELSCSEEIVEKVTLAYTALYCEYKPQNEKGELGSALKAGWDVKINKEWGRQLSRSCLRCLFPLTVCRPAHGQRCLGERVCKGR